MWDDVFLFLAACGSVVGGYVILEFLPRAIERDYERGRSVQAELKRMAKEARKEPRGWRR